jgi:hypothetical protein
MYGFEGEMVCSVANMDQIERSHRSLMLLVPSHPHPNRFDRHSCVFAWMDLPGSH